MSAYSLHMQMFVCSENYTHSLFVVLWSATTISLRNTDWWILQNEHSERSQSVVGFL